MHNDHKPIYPPTLEKRVEPKGRARTPHLYADPEGSKDEWNLSSQAVPCTTANPPTREGRKANGAKRQRRDHQPIRRPRRVERHVECIIPGCPMHNGQKAQTGPQTYPPAPKLNGRAGTPNLSADLEGSKCEWDSGDPSEGSAGLSGPAGQGKHTTPD